MRFYKANNVFEETLERLHYLYDEFDDVYVTVSGGKDSTVCFEMLKMVARERGKLPITVIFIDQEAEYEATIEMIKYMMYDPEVVPYWLQIPIKIFNATSTIQQWLMCWEEGAEWMRPKDPIAIKENIYGTDRFHVMFEKFMAHMVKETGKKLCNIGGMRTEESPGRFIGLTTAATYKHLTYGKINDFVPDTPALFPIYDWSYIDVWKAIHEHGWKYNRIYDYQYNYGLPILKMRVSNLHHETAVNSLFSLQEMEPETYQKLTKRISGADMAGKLGKEKFWVNKLPFMFSSWVEYREFLLEKLITDPKHIQIFRKMFDDQDKTYACAVGSEHIAKTHIQSILTNDYHGTKSDNARLNWEIHLSDYKRKKAEYERTAAALRQG